MKKHIPNIITSANLFSGCIGIIYALNHPTWFLASFFIALAAIFDFFDGMVARLLKVSSNIGKDLDSLADVVSFGVLPSVIIYKFLSQTSHNPYLPFCAFLLTVFSALRLAKFNNDERQTQHFIGVPTPANALVIATFPLLYHFNSNTLTHLMNHTSFWLTFILCMSYLLIAEIPLMSLKIKSLQYAENRFIFFLLLGTLLLVFMFKFASALPILLLYLTLSKIKFSKTI